MRKDFHRRVDRLGEELARRGVRLRRATLVEVAAATLGYGSSNEAIADADATLPRAEPATPAALPGLQVLRDPVAGRAFGVDRALVASCDRGRVVVSPYGNALVVEPVPPAARVAAGPGWSVVADAPERPAPSFDELGLEPGQAATLTRVAGRPAGLVVAFGACGTGRSTLVEACVERHVGLLPATRAFGVGLHVERRMRGVTQIVVDRGARHGGDLDAAYAAAVAEVEGRRPDLVYLDEVRSSATAGLALSLARDRVVWATAHASQAGALRRFADLTGRDEAALRGAFSGSVTTRVLMAVCPACATPAGAGEVEARLGPLARSVPSRWLGRLVSRSADGCPTCREARASRRGLLRPGLSGGHALVAEVVDHGIAPGAAPAEAAAAWRDHPDSLTQVEHCWVRALRGEVDLEAVRHHFDLGAAGVRVERVEACLAV